MKVVVAGQAELVDQAECGRWAVYLTHGIGTAADDTPFTLVGPGGREVSAVGLSWTTDSFPYDKARPWSARS